MTETPNRLDTVKAFRVFVATNSAPLQKYAAQEGFAANLARNDAPAGPVHEEGKRRLGSLKCIKLLRDYDYEIWEHAKYRPVPACIGIFEGHLDSVASIAVSADGRQIITGSRDKTIRIWDNDTATCRLVLVGHEDEVSSVAVSANGRIVLSGSWDTTLRVWNIDSGECLKVLKGHVKNITSVAITSDGSMAVSGSWDNSIRVWDLSSGECIKTLYGHTQSITSVVISSDGFRVISSSRDTTLRVWNIHSGECIKILQSHESEVTSVAASADGLSLLSSGRDKAILFWETEIEDCTEVANGDSSPSENHNKCINSLGVTSDLKRVVSGSDDGTLKLWDIKSGECLKACSNHGGAVTAVAITTDGRYIFSTDHSGKTYKWDSVSCPNHTSMEWGEWENWMFVKTNQNQCIFDESSSHKLFETGCEISDKMILKVTVNSTLKLQDKPSGNCIAEFYLRGLSKDGNDWGDINRLVVGMSTGMLGVRQMSHKGDITNHCASIFKLEII